MRVGSDAPRRALAWVVAVWLWVVVGAWSRPLGAQGETAPAGGSQNATELAKATQNPVADLVSVPFQFNFFTGAGLGSRSLFNLNIQPVLPLRLDVKWTLIARTIVPYLNVPGANDTRLTGLGDIQEQLFLTPTKPAEIIWGAGTIFSLPTATNDAVRTGQWGFVPSAVVLTIKGPFVFGTLLYQFWRIAGNNNGPDVSQLGIQPFLNFNFGVGWALGFSPLITANWNQPSGEQWTVPIGFGITKVTAVGRQPVNVGMQYYHNVVRPSTAGSSQLRIILSLLYPIKK